MIELKELQRELKEIRNIDKIIKDRYSKRYQSNKNEFEAIFKQIWEIDTNTSKENPFSTKDVTEQAIKKAGFKMNGNTAIAFKEHENDYWEHQELDKKGFQLSLQIATLSIPTEPEHCPDEWQFIPIHIIMPTELSHFLDEEIKNDTKLGKGFYLNVTDIPEEDEFLDDCLLIDIFGLQCSFVPFLDELKQYRVIGKNGFLSDNFTRYLFLILKNEAEFIKENTAAPGKVKNHISNTIIEFDKLPIWGLFFQILTLQGLSRWLEGMDMNKGDNGYKEVQSLYNWLCKPLIEKMIQFCYTAYGDGDKKLLKPFCNYLYSTEIGQMVQKWLFSKKESCQEQAEPIQQTINSPDKLNTDEAPENAYENNMDTFHSGDTKENLIVIFERLKENKYFDAEADIQTWLYICGVGGQKSPRPLNWVNEQQLLANLVDVLFGDSDGQRLWIIAQKVFTVKGKQPNTDAMKNTISKIKNNWKDRPKKFDNLERLLKV